MAAAPKGHLALLLGNFNQQPARRGHASCKLHPVNSSVVSWKCLPSPTMRRLWPGVVGV